VKSLSATVAGRFHSEIGGLVAIPRRFPLPSRNFFTQFGERTLLGPDFASRSYFQKIVRTIYWETLAAINRSSPVLTGIGIRAFVESVCKHKRIKGATLKDRIDGLAKSGLLGAAEARVLHRLRFLGNKVAHEIKAGSAAELAAGMDVAEHLLTTVYLLPLKARRLPSHGR
jgi:Domain of unknown function (DUF4145)